MFIDLGGKLQEQIKPLHGVCCAPFFGSGDRSLFHYLGEAGIPYSRLHDTGGEFGRGVFVDIDNIFRDPDGDPDDPACYDFAFTDWLITNLEQQGVKAFYRLGPTIENYQRIKPYHINPPKDFHKWARVCAGIIRHYNHGWADGFHYGLEYWEIWNEPENEPDVADNTMWKGTIEEFFDLYVITANHLKKEFPEIKVGGYASCGFYAITGTPSPQAKVSARFEHFVTVFHQFLKHISSPEHTAPLDFFSWHSYSCAEEVARQAAYADETLKSYGFHNTENIFDEWNPGTQNRGTPLDAALIAGMMVTLQDTPVDKAMYYDASVTCFYCGMFSPMNGEPFKAYYSFKAFNELYKLKNRVECTASGSIKTLAASDGKKTAVLAVNESDRSKRVTLRRDGKPVPGMSVTVTDKRRTEAAETIEGPDITLGAQSVTLILL